MSYTARDILQRAHDELLARERLLTKFEQELTETRKARLALEKQLRALGGNVPKALPSGEPSRRGVGPVDVTQGVPKQIVDAVTGSLDPLTAAQVAQAIGRDPAPWIGAQIARLVQQGDLIKVTDNGETARFGVPQKLAATDLDPALNGVAVLA